MLTESQTESSLAQDLSKPQVILNNSVSPLVVLLVFSFHILPCFGHIIRKYWHLLSRLSTQAPAFFLEQVTLSPFVLLCFVVLYLIHSARSFPFLIELCKEKTPSKHKASLTQTKSSFLSSILLVSDKAHASSLTLVCSLFMILRSKRRFFV